MTHYSGCLVCGADLQYIGNYQSLECHYCKETFQSDVLCLNGHFVCDKCHALSGTELIEIYCNSSKSVNPVRMATEIMQNGKISMHGPEHHFLVPAVLIAVYCNLTNDPGKKEKISKARQRSEKIPGGFCGTHGNCGAGVGTGIL
jgi:hypothetical protein